MTFDDDINELLIYLDTFTEGKNLSEVVVELTWSKERTAKAIGIAENFGMVRGNWERLPNGRWIRRYYLASEGTKDYIENIRNVHSSDQRVKT